MQRLLQVNQTPKSGLFDVWRRCVSGGLRTDGWWIKDHRPRRWPRTPEERAAAAAKYGLRLGDYKPFPEDDFRGHYPDLGHMNWGVKDPNENWTHYNQRRNWNEPVFYNFDTMNEHKETFTGTESESRMQVIMYFFAIFGSTFTLLFLLAKYDMRAFAPAKPKQLPWDFYKAYPFDDPRAYPMVHYTFDPPKKGDAHGHHKEEHH